MGSLVLTGDTSGSGTINVPAIAGSFTATIGSATGTHYPFTAGTAVASTSGTSIDFTSIPSWVKRITVMFSGVSTSGTSIIQIQLGDAGGIETSGYTGSAFTTNTANALNSSGFALRANAFTAAETMQGLVTLALLDPSNSIWVCQGVTSKSASADTSVVSGSKALSPGPLTQIRITTVNGTDTFDAGSINILYE